MEQHGGPDGREGTCTHVIWGRCDLNFVLFVLFWLFSAGFHFKVSSRSGRMAAQPKQTYAREVAAAQWGGHSGHITNGGTRPSPHGWVGVTNGAGSSSATIAKRRAEGGADANHFFGEQVMLNLQRSHIPQRCPPSGNGRVEAFLPHHRLTQHAAVITGLALAERPTSPLLWTAWPFGTRVWRSHWPLLLRRSIL